MSTYRPTENDGRKVDGGEDKRLNPEHGFGGDRDAAREYGKEGGAKGGRQSDLDPDLPEKEDSEYNPDAPEVWIPVQSEAVNVTSWNDAIVLWFSESMVPV